MDDNSSLVQSWKEGDGNSEDHPVGKLGFILGNRVAMRVGALAGLSMAAIGLLGDNDGFTPLTTITGTADTYDPGTGDLGRGL